MTYLVDANVLSEPTKSLPDEAVVGWLRIHEREIAVDAVILAEIRLGIVRLPRGRRRERLENWFSEGVGKLTCLSWDRKTAIRWADLILKVQGLGYTLPLFDSMIAATALVHGLVIVTRNVRDFEHAGVSVLNPFE